MRAFILMVGVLTVMNNIIVSHTTHAACTTLTANNYKNINFKLWDGFKGVKLTLNVLLETYETVDY